MTNDDRVALRRAIISGPTDCPLDRQEAAVFLGVSDSSFRALNLPRADVAGPTYLKSDLLLYVRLRLSHRLVERVA